MLSCDSLILHVFNPILRSGSNIPGKLHFDINVDLGFHFLYVVLAIMSMSMYEEYIQLLINELEMVT